MTLHDPFYDDAHAHPDENAAGGGGSAPEQEFGAAIVRPATGGSDALVPAGGVFEGQVAVVAETRVEGVVRGSLRGPFNTEARLSAGFSKAELAHLDTLAA